MDTQGNFIHSRLYNVSGTCCRNMVNKLSHVLSQYDLRGSLKTLDGSRTALHDPRMGCLFWCIFRCSFLVMIQ